MVLSKSTSIIFKESVYYKEYILLRTKSKYLNFNNICKEGCLNLLKAYIKNFHGREYDKYNIIEAAKNSHLEVTEYLVPAGADNSYAVQYASQNGHLEVVEYLVSVGADIREENNFCIRKL